MRKKEIFIEEDDVSFITSASDVIRRKILVALAILIPVVISCIIAFLAVASQNTSGSSSTNNNNNGEPPVYFNSTEVTINFTDTNDDKHDDKTACATSACTWKQVPVQFLPDPDEADLLGWAVSLSPDGAHVAVGAPHQGDDKMGYVQILERTTSPVYVTTDTLYGSFEGDRFGSSLAWDGRRLAVGAPSDTGYVRVYEFSADNNRWQQMGRDVLGDGVGDWFGYSLSLSGGLLAVGAPNHGRVRVFRWCGTDWETLGQALDETTLDHLSSSNNHRFGIAVSISGRRLAVGDDWHDQQTGEVRVFEWNDNAWRPFGPAISGPAPKSLSGRSVVLEGHRLAIGAAWGNGVRPRNSNASANANADSNAKSKSNSNATTAKDHDNIHINWEYDYAWNAGQVRVLEFDWTIQDWRTVGTTLDGAAPGDLAGSAVALTADRIAVGAAASHRQDHGNVMITGQVRVFEWSPSQQKTSNNNHNNNNDWSLVGDALDGQDENDGTGHAVALSAKGNILAVGARNSPGRHTKKKAGALRIYEWADPLHNIT